MAIASRRGRNASQARTSSATSKVNACARRATTATRMAVASRHQARPEECKDKGWIWDGKRCLSPADACKLKGWNWDDGRCLAPTNPADECRKAGGTWDGKRKRCLTPGR